MQKFIKLKELASNTVGEDNEIFSLQLQSLLNLYNQSANEVDKLEKQIIFLINEIQLTFSNVIICRFGTRLLSIWNF